VLAGWLVWVGVGGWLSVEMWGMYGIYHRAGEGYGCFRTGKFTFSGGCRSMILCWSQVDTTGRQWEHKLFLSTVLVVITYVSRI